MFGWGRPFRILYVGRKESIDSIQQAGIFEAVAWLRTGTVSCHCVIRACHSAYVEYLPGNCGSVINTYLPLSKHVNQGRSNSDATEQKLCCGQEFYLCYL